MKPGNGVVNRPVSENLMDPLGPLKLCFRVLGFRGQLGLRLGGASDVDEPRTMRKRKDSPCHILRTLRIHLPH
jgi:hypothetical protein